MKRARYPLDGNESEDIKVGATARQVFRFMTGLLRIQPGEGRKTGLMFGILLCVVGFFITGRVARDSLFLSRYSVDYLPYLYIWVALGVSVQSYLYSRIADRFRRDRTLIATLAAVLVVTLAARVSLYWVGDWFYPVLYVTIELAGTLLIIQTWTLANEIFDTREAKRLFGIVGAGGVVSAVIVGLSVRGLVKTIGTENLLYLCAGVLVVALVLTAKVLSSCREEILSSMVETGRQARARISLSSDWARFFANRQLVFVAGLIVILGFVITFVDYQFKITARNAFLNREEQLAGFFGAFWAVTGGINCIIQFFLTGRILERLGILFALLILPLSLLAGTGVLLIIPALWSATMLKGSEVVFRYTVNDATMQLLYLPVPSHFRGRAKAFIDGIIRPLSIGLSGVALAWVLPGLPRNALGWFLLGLLLVWIYMVFGARKQYYNSLMRTLQTRRFHFGEVGDIIPDDAAATVLRQALTDPDEQNVMHALDMTRYSPTIDWSNDLVRILSHKSPTVRARALQLLGEKGSLEDGPQVFARLKDSNPSVRAAAVGAYCAIGRERAIRVISSYLGDVHAEVRAATVVGLIRYGGLDGVLSAAEKLKSMLESPDAEDRAVGARILGDIGVKNFYHPLLALMLDDDVKVRIAAIKAAGEMQSPELMPALVYRIEDPVTRAAASEALAAFGPSAVRLLVRVLENPDEGISTRLAIPAILARIADKKALDALIDHIEDPNEEMRVRTLEGIHRIRLRKPHLVVPRKKIERAVRMETRSLYHQWFVKSDLELERGSLLDDALIHRRDMTIRRIFRLLGCLLPVRTIDAIFNNLSSPLRRVHANAVELLDSMLEKEIKRLLVPLLDETLIEDRIEIGREVFGLKRSSHAERLADLVQEDNPWLKSCAIWMMGQAGEEENAEVVLDGTVSDSTIVRETTLEALGKLLPAERFHKTLKRHLKDSSPAIRKYASWLLRKSQQSHSPAS